MTSFLVGQRPAATQDDAFAGQHAAEVVVDGTPSAFGSLMAAAQGTQGNRARSDDGGRQAPAAQGADATLSSFLASHAGAGSAAAEGGEGDTASLDGAQMPGAAAAVEATWDPVGGFVLARGPDAGNGLPSADPRPLDAFDAAPAGEGQATRPDAAHPAGGSAEPAWSEAGPAVAADPNPAPPSAETAFVGAHAGTATADQVRAQGPRAGEVGSLAAHDGDNGNATTNGTAGPTPDAAEALEAEAFMADADQRTAAEAATAADEAVGQRYGQAAGLGQVRGNGSAGDRDCDGNGADGATLASTAAVRPEASARSAGVAAAEAEQGLAAARAATVGPAGYGPSTPVTARGAGQAQPAQAEPADAQTDASLRLQDEEGEKVAAADPGQTLANMGAALALLGLQPQGGGNDGVHALDALTAKNLVDRAAVGPAGGRRTDAVTLAGDAPGDGEATEIGEGLGVGSGPQAGGSAAPALGLPPVEEGEMDGRSGAPRDLVSVQGAGSHADARAPRPNLDPEGSTDAAVNGTTATGEAQAVGHAQQAGLAQGVDATSATQQAQRTLEAANAQTVSQARVSQELADAVHQGSRTIHLKVAPPGMGELGINVRVIGGQVQMRVQGDAPELAQVLRQHVAQLQEGLQGKGLQLQSLDFQEREPSGGHTPQQFDPRGPAAGEGGERGSARDDRPEGGEAGTQRIVGNRIGRGAGALRPLSGGAAVRPGSVPQAQPNGVYTLYVTV